MNNKMEIKEELFKLFQNKTTDCKLYFDLITLIGKVKNETQIEENIDFYATLQHLDCNKIDNLTLSRLLEEKMDKIVFKYGEHLS